MMGLLLVTATVTPALVALSPYSVSFATVTHTSPLIVAAFALASACGGYLYERYGVKAAKISWYAIFFTFALPATIINVVGFACMVRLVGAVASPKAPVLIVLIATLLFALFLAFFMMFAIAIVKPTVLDKRWRWGILVALYAITVGKASSAAFVVALPAALGGAAAGLWLARALGKRIGSLLLVLRSLWPYVRAMIGPTLAFLIGYLMIAFIFAGLAGLVYRLDPTSFNGVGRQPPFSVFFYHTVVTMTTVGYGDITPVSSLARCVSGATALVALCWLTVVFAAVIAFLQPRFAKIASEMTQRHEHS